jgi:hypothetical protein
MLHYFYRADNLVNGRYYYGIHSQDESIPDVYLGSGKALDMAIIKYGRQSFKKTILKYFLSRDEAFAYERLVVNENVIRDPKSYNIAIGGNGGILAHSEETKALIKTRLARYWENPNNKVKHSNAVKDSIAWQKSVQRVIEKGLVKGVKNPAFKITHQKFALVKDKICFLAINTDMPTYFILQILGIRAHFEDVITHCEYSQWLPIIYDQEVIARYFSLKGARPDGASLRNIYNENPEYRTIFLYPAYFEGFKRILRVHKDMAVSDSVLTQPRLSSYISSYRHIICYMKELGIIENVREVIIRCPAKPANRPSYTVPGKKTVFDFNPRGLNKIIFDKELNTYGVNDNGEPFQQGRFRLGENGCWGVYGCNRKKYKNSKFQP